MIRSLYQIGLKLLSRLNNEQLYALARRWYAPRLAKLLLHITPVCNYDCTYCYVDKTKPGLAEQDWFSLLEQAKPLGVTKISVLGGEPLCTTFLPQLLAKTRSLGMKPYVYTNGSLLDKGWIARLKPYRPVLIFKYEADEETYRLYTGQKKIRLGDVEQTIRDCKSAGFTVMTFTALTARNAAYVEEIFDRSVRLGAFPAFERYLPVRDAATNAALELPDPAYRTAMAKISRKLRKYEDQWKAAIRIAGRSCGCYTDILSITPSGEALPCPYLPESASLGNVRRLGLGEIYRILQEKQKTVYKAPDKCAACEHRYSCGGGCFTYSYLKKKTFEAQCNEDTAIGFCSYLLVDLYDDFPAAAL